MYNNIELEHMSFIYNICHFLFEPAFFYNVVTMFAMHIVCYMFAILNGKNYTVPLINHECVNT